MPKDVTWADITQEDDLLKVPIFGNEEDAADQFATYFFAPIGRIRREG